MSGWIYLPLFVALLGLAVYCYKTKDIGQPALYAWFAGLIVTLWEFATHVVKL